MCCLVKEMLLNPKKRQLWRLSKQSTNFLVLLSTLQRQSDYARKEWVEWWRRWKCFVTGTIKESSFVIKTLIITRIHFRREAHNIFHSKCGTRREQLWKVELGKIQEKRPLLIMNHWRGKLFGEHEKFLGRTSFIFHKVSNSVRQKKFIKFFNLASFENDPEIPDN